MTKLERAEKSSKFFFKVSKVFLAVMLISLIALFVLIIVAPWSSILMVLSLSVVSFILGFSSFLLSQEFEKDVDKLKK